MPRALERTASAGIPQASARAPEIWCVDLVASGAALRAMEAHTPRLAEPERERARALADTAAAAEWLTAHIALRLLVERHAGARWRGVAFARTREGKPHLGDAGVAFSLAHVRGLALIGLARGGAIGVDVERARPVRVEAARRRRLEEAGAGLNPEARLPEGADARFLRAWVRLEAFAKAHGCGLGRLLAQLGIIGERGVEGDVRARLAPMRDAAPGMAVHDLELGAGLFAAVALAPAQAAPAVSWLPASLDGLDKLLG